jgi:SAM-dependent methyltransferase
VRFRCPRCAGSVPLSSTDPSECPSCRTPFPLDGGILSLGVTRDDRDYPERLVSLIAGVEERHFWFAARNDVIVSTLRRAIGPLRDRQLVDIGCGTGFVLAALEAAGVRGCGIDMHATSLRIARTRVRGPLVLSDAAELPFFADFEVSTLFDVIEHVDDDVDVLRQARDVLAPRGFIVVTVPAGQHLWTPYDDASGHKRRYDRAGLIGVLERAELEVLKADYFNCLPLVAQSLHRRISSPGPDEAADPVTVVERALRVPQAPLNALFRLAVRVEAPLRRISAVRGGSLIAVARRR